MTSSFDAGIVLLKSRSKVNVLLRFCLLYFSENVQRSFSLHCDTKEVIKICQVH